MNNKQEKYYDYIVDDIISKTEVNVFDRFYMITFPLPTALDTYTVDSGGMSETEFLSSIRIGIPFFQDIVPHKKIVDWLVTNYGITGVHEGIDVFDRFKEKMTKIMDEYNKRLL